MHAEDVSSDCHIISSFGVTRYSRSSCNLAALWKAALKAFWQVFRNTLPIQITGVRHTQTWQNPFCCTRFMIVISSLEIPVNNCMATFSWQPLEKVWNRVSAGLPMAENKEVKSFLSTNLPGHMFGVWRFQTAKIQDQSHLQSLNSYYEVILIKQLVTVFSNPNAQSACFEFLLNIRENKHSGTSKLVVNSVGCNQLWLQLMINLFIVFLPESTATNICILSYFVPQCMPQGFQDA